VAVTSVLPSRSLGEVMLLLGNEMIELRFFWWTAAMAWNCWPLVADAIIAPTKSSVANCALPAASVLRFRLAAEPSWILTSRLFFLK
jgi:hypothetical protein